MFKVTILDRYIFKKMIFPFFAGMAGFIVILSIDPMVNAMQYIINQKIPAIIALKWFMYKLPENILYTFPMSTLLASFLTFATLSKNSEITAIRAGGINVFRLMVPVLFFAFLISLLCLFFNEKITPVAYDRQRKIKLREILKIPPSRIKENIFFKDTPNTLIFIGRAFLDDKYLKRIAFYKLEKGKLKEIIFADRAKLLTGKWVFYDVKFFSLIQNSFYRHDKELILPIEHNIESFGKKEKRPKAMNMKELRKYIKEMKKTGLKKTTPLEVEFYQKTSLPFSPFIFVFLGIAMGLQPNRGGAFIGFGISLLIVFVYYVAMSIFKAYGSAGYLPPFLAAWLQNIIFGGIGLYFISKANNL